MKVGQYNQSIEYTTISYSKAEKDRMLENQQKKKVEIAKIRVKLNVLKDDLEIAVRERDFMKAQDMQMEIDELDENLQVSSFLDMSRWGEGEGREGMEG